MLPHRIIIASFGFVDAILVPGVNLNRVIEMNLDPPTFALTKKREFFRIDEFDRVQCFFLHLRYKIGKNLRLFQKRTTVYSTEFLRGKGTQLIETLIIV